MRKCKEMLLFISLVLFAFNAEAKTAVTISIENSPALTENNLQAVDLLVPLRPAAALPLTFEINKGQVDEQVKFLSRGNGYNLFLTPTEMVLALSKSVPSKPSDEKISHDSNAVLRSKLINSNPNTRMAGIEELSGKSNYFLGNDRKKWQTDIPHYSKVRYEGVYPGIDLVYYGNHRQLEYDFVVAPGSDPNVITVGFDGANSLEIDSNNNLILSLGEEQIILKAPIVYQEIDGIKKYISGRYMFKNTNQIGFQIASYNMSLPLVIDPVLVYSTYLGGDSFDSGNAIAVGADGSMYITGKTASINFPLANPAQQTYGGFQYDMFIARINAAGDGLIFSTFLGGSWDEPNSTFMGLALDSSGNAYLAGSTQSENFPTTVGAFQENHGGGANGLDGVVAKLDMAGILIYSTYLGGAGDDRAFGIAVDSLGNAHVTGETGNIFPSNNNFPTKNPIQTTASYFADAFVTVFNAAGSDLIYSTFFGGIGYDYGDDIAVDSAGKVYIVGQTGSTDLPIPFTTRIGSINGNVFVAKINIYADVVSDQLIYLTGLGGSKTDEARGIVVNSNGEAHILGITASVDFPMSNDAAQAFLGGSSDTFIAKLNSSGSSLIYSTYLGGSSYDASEAIALDADGNVYVTGWTNSVSDFPTVNAIQSEWNGGTYDAFVAKLNTAGSEFIYSTFLGGWGDKKSFGIALDALGNVYVTGQTNSTEFPLKNPWQGTLGGDYDAFIVKIGEDESPIADAGASQTVHIGETATLDGSLSTDPDENYPLTYEWTMDSRPDLSESELELPQSISPTFYTDRTGEYRISLIVTDSEGLLSEPDEVLISTFNSAPIAVAGSDETVPRGIEVTLNGRSSSDPDEGDELEYAWILQSGPEGSAAVLTDVDKVDPSFTPDMYGNYVVQLKVTDNWGAVSEPDTVDLVEKKWTLS